MSIQGVFNTKLSEKIGLWETTVLTKQLLYIIVDCVYFLHLIISFLKSGIIVSLVLYLSVEAQ